MKRFGSAILGALVLLLVLALLPARVFAATCEAHDYVDGFCSVCGNYKTAPLKDGYYEIYTSGQLYWFAKQVNSGKTEINGKLMSDIVVNAGVLSSDGALNGDGSGLRSWMPIGTQKNQYKGTFDGNGKTVSGLYMNENAMDIAGLFGEVASSGVIKNVVIKDSFIRIWITEKADLYVGGIVGYNFGIVQDCRNEATVSANERSAGGICGGNEGQVLNCVNAGRIEGYVMAAGIAGYNGGGVTQCRNVGIVESTGWWVGGIVGANHGNIADSRNEADVSAVNQYGGIAGSNGNEGKIQNCRNDGNLIQGDSIGGIVGWCMGQVDGCTNYGSAAGSNKIGGIVGGAEAGSVLTNCINLGSIHGQKYAAGLVGSNCGQVKNSFSAGSVTGDDMVGGIVGHNMDDGWFRNCYYLNETVCVDCGSKTEAKYGRNAQQFASGLVAWELNGGDTSGKQVFYQELGKDAYPGFQGGTVYQATEGCVTFSNISGGLKQKQHSGSAASCADGVTCPDCGAVIGHQYSTSVVEPTCQQGGHTVYTCIDCGDSYAGNYTAAAPHSYEQGRCAVCGALTGPEITSCYSRNQTSVKVTWSVVEGASGYYLYRSTDATGLNMKKIKTIEDGTVDRYTNQGLTPGVTYYYRVCAYFVNSDGTRTVSANSQIAYMPAAVVFDGPYSNSTERIRLLWNEVGGAHGYQIWRKEADGSWKIVKTIGDKGNTLTVRKGDVTAYSNTGLEAGGVYTYKMRAFMIDEHGRKVFGAYSDEYRVAVMPEIPNLKVTSPKSGRAKLVWNGASGATGYQVWMSTSPNGDFTIVKSITDGSESYTKYELESGKTYYFKVRAYVEVDGRKTFSGYSAMVAITIK